MGMQLAVSRRGMNKKSVEFVMIWELQTTGAQYWHRIQYQRYSN